MRHRTAAFMGGLTAMVGALICVEVVRFSNSSLTETQLFLKFWWLWILLAGIVVASARFMGWPFRGKS